MSDKSDFNTKLQHYLQAKQRASVLWLLSKAYSNEIPPDLKDPFYKDHEENDRLKPQIVQSLANAELYCLTLANIYSDPNYHCLNHYGIMQILMRKGVYMVEPNDSSLTETVLIQNAPIKMSAHMVIIEAIMTLYIKEVLIPEKVAEVVNRFSYVEDDEIPEDLEEVAIFWINKCCVRLKQIMQKEMNENESTRSEPIPSLPMLEELTDLSDGCNLAALLSFYCPDHLRWQEISLNGDMSLADSIYNLQLVLFFCEEKLPFNCCFLTLEDMLYLHETIQTNVLAFIADLLFHFEIRPAECVRQPGLQCQSDVTDSESHNGLCYPELPTPSEMKAKSLQHSSWVDERLVSEQSNGTTPTRTPRRSISSAKHVNRQKSASQHLSDEDEELTRYFSAIDLKTENELTPEIVTIANRSAHKSGPKSINAYNNRTDYDLNPKEVILSSDPSKHELNEKSSSQLVDYFSQLSEGNTSATKRRSSATNRRISQNLMNSSIVLGTDSPPLPVPNASNTSTISFGKLNSKTFPSVGDSEPAINIAYLQKNDKNCVNSNCLPTTQSSQMPAPTSHHIPNSSINSNTISFCKSNSSQNSVTNVSAVGAEQPFYLQEDQSTGSGQRSLINTFNSRTKLNKSDSIDSLLGENEKYLCDENNSVDSEIASQVHNIRMKLEEKRRKIEMERLSAEEDWKSSRQNIGKEAFLRVIHKNGGQEVPNQLMVNSVMISAPEYMNHQRIAPEVMHNQRVNNQMIGTEYINHQMVGQQMIAPEGMNHQMMSHQALGPQMNNQVLNHPMMSGQQVLGHQMVNQNPNSFYITSQPNMSGISIPPQQVFEDYDLQQQLYSSSPPSKPMIGRTFRVLKPKVMSPDRSSGHISPTRSVVSEFSDEGFNNYEKSAKSSSSSSTKDDSTTGDPNYTNGSFFISFDNNKPRVKPGLKPKHVKQQQQMRRELNQQLKSANIPTQQSSDYTKGRTVQSNSDVINSVSPGVGFMIGTDLVHPDPCSELEMAKKKESIMLSSLKRRERLEEERLRKEQSLAQKRQDERVRREASERKKDEERVKRQQILEQYRQRKAAEESEKDGSVSKDMLRSNSTLVLNRPSRLRNAQKPRPKSLHVSASNIQDYSSLDCNKSRIVDDTDACLLSSNTNMSRPESAMSGQSSQSHASHVPPFMFSRFRSDGPSDGGSMFSEYTGPKLFVKPSQKSNKTLILNAINAVLAGAVNYDTKVKVLEHINGSDSKHFLILFRNAGLQFRAVYTYNPDREEVFKLYGTGPKSVTNEVIERFYKYNSGSKTFAEIQTKHLSVTIDAFIIHNSLWTGKRLIPKKDYL